MTFALPDEAGGDPALVSLVISWVTAENWGQSRLFLTDHAGDLLTDHAATTMQLLIAANPSQQVLGLHQELLEAARVGGIDVAYAAIDESIRHFALAERLVAWVSTQSWPEARQFFDEQAAEFATDEAESVLDELVDDNRGQPDLLAHQGLLTLIRLDGPDEAFSILEAPDQLGDLVTSAANRDDPARAIPRARLLAGLYPDNLGAQLALATTALALGERNEALRAIARCADSVPKEQQAELGRQLATLAEARPDMAADLMVLQGLLD